MDSLANKVALITGASSGIGEGLAREFARRGAIVAVLARRKKRLDDLARELDPRSERILAIECDVTKESDLAAAVQQVVVRFGRLDIVVANAGVSVAGTVESASVEEYRLAFDTNVFGVVNTVRAAAEALRASHGTLAIIGSMAGFGLVPGAAPYVMSKFGVRGLADSLRLELAPTVSVTHIAPGFVASEIRGAKDPAPAWLILSTAAASRTIVNAIARRRRECVLPFHAKAYVAAERHAPWLSRRIISLKRRLPEGSREVQRRRTVLITGAASGIGAALADLFAERGDNIVLFDRDPRIVERWAQHDRAVAAVGDVRDRAALDRAIALGVERVGPIDTVFANAGIVLMGPLVAASPDKCREVFEVNVFGAINTVQATLPSLRSTRGRLAIVGSASGYLPYAGLAIYNTSKFAVRGMTRQLMHELEPAGITVTHVAPGAVDTNIWPGQKPPGSMSARQAAVLIAEAVDAGKRELIFPSRTRAEVLISRHAPRLHAWRIRGVVVK
jgi:NAD(P)-dependent dehydrogenase (short-subunit alcohol dehydrogenase family)